MSRLAKKCVSRLKKVPKRFGESEKVATFATALREKHSSKAKKQVLKIFEKFLQKDLEKRKTCLTFATAFASKTKATF
jgi:menaquinone-dependent protoporphyrinogen IX oxidase